MKSVLSLQLGQGGNTIGLEFWKQLYEEHQYDSSDNREVYFDESRKGEFTPRAILADSEPGTVEMIRASEYGKRFVPNNIVAGAYGYGNNWAKGYYTDGVDILPEIIEGVRKEAEKTNGLHCIQLIHTLGAATGSGLGALVLENLRDEYSETELITFSVTPSPRVSDVVVEPYNAVLGLRHLVELADAVFIYDNGAILKSCEKSVGGYGYTRYRDMNPPIARAMSGFTAALRYPPSGGVKFTELLDDLVPYAPLHFFSSSLVPCFGEMKTEKISEVIAGLQLSYNNLSYEPSSFDKREISSLLNMRGNFSEEDLAFCRNHKFTRKNLVVETPGSLLETTLVRNSSSIVSSLMAIGVNFDKMFKRKAFLHWYKGEGMDENEFNVARRMLTETCLTYRDFSF